MATTCAAPSAQTADRPYFLENTVNSHLTVLYAGSLDDPSWYEPGRDIFVSSAQPWNPMNMELPKHDKMPEMPK